MGTESNDLDSLNEALREVREALGELAEITKDEDFEGLVDSFVQAGGSPTWTEWKLMAPAEREAFVVVRKAKEKADMAAGILAMHPDQPDLAIPLLPLQEAMLLTSEIGAANSIRKGK